MATSASDSTSMSDGGDEVSVAVVEAVSAADGRDVLELPPLYEAVDADALDSLFEDPRTVDRVEFRYAGYAVTVRGDQTVTASPID